MKKHPGLAAAFSIAAAFAGAAAARGTDGWEQEVRAAEARHRAAFLAGDAAALEDLLADSFLVNSPLYTVATKEQVVGMVRKGTLTISAFDQQIEMVRRYGDIVVVMGADSVVYAAPSPKAGQTERRRFTDLWRLESGRWHFAARHANIICP